MHKSRIPGFNLRYAIICEYICPAGFRQKFDRIQDRTFFQNPADYPVGLDARYTSSQYVRRNAYRFIIKTVYEMRENFLNR